MGLPLAPEIARVVTAYQLDTRLDLQPPVTLSLYFYNLYTSHPPAVMLDVFLPFILTEEPLNTFQDAGYHRDLREFCPNPLQFRTPIPIHPHSTRIMARLQRKYPELTIFRTPIPIHPHSTRIMARLQRKYPELTITQDTETFYCSFQTPRSLRAGRAALTSESPPL